MTQQISTAVICIWMHTCAVLCVLQFFVANAAPIAHNSTNSSSNSSLREVIACAVTDAVSDLTVSIPVDTETITTRIIHKLKTVGIDDCNTPTFTSDTNSNCKTRREEYLVEKFYANQITSRARGCLRLQNITLPTHNKTIHHILTGSTECLDRLRYDSECFPARDRSPYCKWAQSIEAYDDLGEDYFPRFAVQVTCEGCSLNDRHCREQRNNCYYTEHHVGYHLLSRQEACDSDGYEDWKYESKQRRLIVGCGCVQYK